MGGGTGTVWHKKFCHIWTGRVTGVQCYGICKNSSGCWGFNLPSRGSVSSKSFGWCRLYGTITSTGTSGVAVSGSLAGSNCNEASRVSVPDFSATTDWNSGNSGNEPCFLLQTGKAAPTTTDDIDEAELIAKLDNHMQAQ